MLSTFELHSWIIEKIIKKLFGHETPSVISAYDIGQSQARLSWPGIAKGHLGKDPHPKGKRRTIPPHVQIYLTIGYIQFRRYIFSHERHLGV